MFYRIQWQPEQLVVTIAMRTDICKHHEYE